MKKSDKLLLKAKHQMWEHTSRSSKLASAIAERNRVQRENAELRALLASVMEERDRYKEKLRQALGVMEDAREMAWERAS